jgi:hypothetical protein
MSMLNSLYPEKTLRQALQIVSRKQFEISDMPGDLRKPGRPCSVYSPLRPRAPRSGSSPIAQAPALAQPSFLNIIINMNTAVLRVFSTTI